MRKNELRFGLILFLSLISSIGFCGLIDSFDDNDFTNNPTWQGDSTEWEIIKNSIAGPGTSDSYTLALNAPKDSSGTKYLWIQKIGSWGVEQSWGFWLGRRSSAPGTDKNQSIVWLWASGSNLTGAVNGYRIRFGNDSVDAKIYLERVDAGSETVILTSSGAISKGNADLAFLVRVTRSIDSSWTLYSSTLPTANGEGAIATELPSSANTTVDQGTVVDGTYTNFDDGYFALGAKHTTSEVYRTGARYDQFHFDFIEDASLPVTLSTFTATPKSYSIELHWRTESEINNIGFWLYRSEQIDGEYLRINDEIILGAGSSPVAHDYIFNDYNTDRNVSYHYYIEDISIDGSTDRTEVVSATRGDKIKKFLTTWAELKKYE